MQQLQRLRTSFFYYAIFFPAFAVVLFLTVYPVITVLVNSFYEYNYIAGTRTYLGIENFIDIIQESVFQAALRNTVIFSLVATTIEASLGVFLALLFYGRFPGKKPTMITVIFPMMISTMVICAIWKTMYHYDIGIINYVLSSLGVGRVGWLHNEKIALFSVIIVDIWQWTPFAFIIIQAGLNSVPSELFEQASIDGAGYFKTLFFVTLPVLAHQVLLVFLLRTIDTFRIFDKVYALTQGGPGNATETVSYFIYREGFNFFNLGRASAGSIYTLIVISIVAAFYIRHILKEEQ